MCLFIVWKRHVSVSIICPPPAALSPSARVLWSLSHVCVCMDKPSVVYLHLWFIKTQICIFCSLEDQVSSYVDVAKRPMRSSTFLLLFLLIYSFQFGEFSSSNLSLFSSLFPVNVLSVGFPEGFRMSTRPTLRHLSCFPSLCSILLKSN